jgi:chitinase
MKTKKRVKRFVKVFLFLVLLLVIQTAFYTQVNAESDIWVSAYYAGWSQGCGYPGHLNPEQIDFSAVTHVIHFAIVPNYDGSIDYSTNCITPENSAALVNAAHSAGKKVLVSLGGWQTESGFLGAASDRNRAKFIDNLINFLISRGYDGIDMDWEPISASSFSRYSLFITELKDALDNLNPHPLLVVAVPSWQPALFAGLQDKFDQINIMTYDMSGPWLGPVTWHNAAIYDGGYWFPDFEGPAPSANGAVESYLEAGVQSSKLGIGIAFFGYIWSGGGGTPTGGVTAPAQTYTKELSMEVLTYYDIMDSYYQPQYYRWDSAAQAAYLSIDGIGSSNDKFISYDDETTCYEKINYVRNKGIGGVIIFELGGGWRPTAPVPDILLQAVKDAAWEPANPVPLAPALISPLNGATGIPTNTKLTWSASNGADSYTLQVSTTPTFSNLVLYADGILGTLYQVTGLSENTTYYWRVNAMNEKGTSVWSEVWRFTTIPPQSSITVTVPNGTEEWKAGTTQMIRWTYTGNLGKYVKIEILKGGAVERIIKLKTSVGRDGSGSYKWRIPSGQTLGNDCRIRVTSSTNTSVTDTSDGSLTINAVP